MKTLLKYVLAFAGVASLSLSSALADDCINKTCPFSGKEVVGSNSVEFVAKFCCGKCVDKFEKDPTAVAEKVAKAEDGKCAFSGKAASKIKSYYRSLLWQMRKER